MYYLAPTTSATDAYIIGVFADQAVAQLDLLNSEQQASIQKFIDLHGFIADAGKIAMQYFMPGFDQARVILIGLGNKQSYSLSQTRKAMTAAGGCLRELPVKTVQIILPQNTNQQDRLLIRQCIVCLEDANIRRDQLKAKPATQFWPEQLTFVGNFNQAEQGLIEGMAIASGIKLTKELANLPANLCTPTILAQRAEVLAFDQPNLTAEIYDEQAIKALNMGCLLAVAQGSVQPPRLIVLRYTGAAPDQAPTVLLGKGITFDSGGISLKAGLHMDEMKYDMCGAAAVLGVMQAVAALKLPINLIGVIVSCENLPSGSAIKPGDIVTSMSGKTVEILNTDAEGRLILCDGLTFIERFKPKAVIDIATLTGAIVIALGNEASGLMSNNTELAQQIFAAGLQSGDRSWQLPLWEEYQPLLDSAFADIANIGPGKAGSITGGCFLARFAEQYPWAHLDVAGVAYEGGTNLNRAATGRPVPLLMDYLLQ